MNNYMAFRFRMIGALRMALMIACLFGPGVFPIRAATHYVSLAGNNTSPYTNGWASAATNIQLAVNQALANDTVLVSNGTYNLTNQILVTANITLKSLYGTNVLATSSIINGGYPAYTNRCIMVSNTDGIVDGFIITNGCSTVDGGGVYFATPNWGTNAVLRNSLVGWNSSIGSYGGGLSISHGVIVTNCAVVSNTANVTATGGGGIYGGTVSIVGCYIAGNTATNGNGGGIYILDGGTGAEAYMSNCIVFNNLSKAYAGIFNLRGNIYNSTIISNNLGGIGYLTGHHAYCLIAYNTGNGLYVEANGGSGGTNTYCTIINNTGIGVFFSPYGHVMQNSLIAGNSNGISLRGDNIAPVFENCTIVGSTGTGVAIQYQGVLRNCVAWSNATPFTLTSVSGAYIAAISNCCMSSTNFASTNVLASGNTTNNPSFVNYAGGNYRLNGNSPCIDTGTNQNWMTNSVDLDGNIRIRYGTVDMGAYEFIRGGTIVSIR